MVKKLSIEFYEAKRPITEFVTKFGGQPKWFSEPIWPLSKATNEPMRFVGQIAIDSTIFGKVPAKMAYLFITDDAGVDETWDPDKGENALVLQPGLPPPKYQHTASGPTLFKMEKRFFGAAILPKTLEFGTRQEIGEDPDWLSEKVLEELPTTEREAHLSSLMGNKVGGSPYFLQTDEFPEGDGWKLLLQLDSSRVPFFVNLGDAGVGYAFISKDGRQGKFLWQCL